jgi:hypothetical protein
MHRSSIMYASLRGVVAVVAIFVTSLVTADDKYLSHPPLRKTPTAAKRPMGDGPAKFVDAVRGDDAHPGTEVAPWQTLNHAIEQLAAGDTLYVRGGTYYENVRMSMTGQTGKPITIRSYPGEQAVIDGGFREFFESPANAWTPHAAGGVGEFRSANRYPNLRDVVGSFGDSMIGLQTYYYAIDLRSQNEAMTGGKGPGEPDIDPLYCGPGLWYDKATGYIHCRLQHTHVPGPIANYTGVTDPTKLPLVIAPFRSVPLSIDGARHMRLQDLVLRGAGYASIRISDSQDIEFDNLTVWCGTYGLQVIGTERLTLRRSGFYGSLAPWTFRADASKRDYPGRPHRNISRLNTHALLEIDSGRESSVFATPQNDHWEIEHCEFTDAHDGVYLGSINVRFHHNLIDNLQDDGIYLSPMYLRHRLDNKDPVIEIYQNRFQQLLTGLAFGGNECETRDRVFIYRNIFDLRAPVSTGRHSKEKEPSFHRGQIIGDHGSPPWSAMAIYHNTFVIAEQARSADVSTTAASTAITERRVFNNLYYHFARLPAMTPPDADKNVVADGNLYWSPAADAKLAASFFTKFRASPLLEASKRLYAAGSASHSLVADPRFVEVSADPAAANDYHVAPMSPAIDAGVDLPADWPDPLRKLDANQPDIGALPAGSPAFEVGRSTSRS